MYKAVKLSKEDRRILFRNTAQDKGMNEPREARSNTK